MPDSNSPCHPDPERSEGEGSLRFLATLRMTESREWGCYHEMKIGVPDAVRGEPFGSAQDKPFGSAQDRLVEP
ncbi:MAG: hypothetical protein COS88_05115 [Chloroflexi bacterium CG07_land_8_20_14_0_80_51_10]|nr:MAG: hypothetical protein COS88_05115 [Chloroflexi bacterium CG07_land_8_20_14_0_80_51_10]